MSQPVDEALRAELEAVREASRPGEIVAVSRAAEKSVWRYIGGSALREVLLWLLLIAGAVAIYFVL